MMVIARIAVVPLLLALLPLAAFTLLERERADLDHDDVPDVYEAEAREQDS